jgi:plastocyanin
VLGRVLAVCGLAAVLVALSLGLLAAADYTGQAGGIPTSGARLRWTIDHGDHLHFAVHVAAGRVLDLCPCTRRAAAMQYYRASFHATTPAQKALLKNLQPHTPGELVAYAAAPFVVGAEWVGAGVSWLAGNRPVSQAQVSMTDGEFLPPELHVAPGVTVSWRNEGDDAHAVVADSGLFQSDVLEPGESFSFRFSARGRYQYYCPIYGGPGLEGMAGVVIVD